MTPTQQRKIAELLVTKLKQAHNQPYEEILPPSVKQNQIRQKMVLAGVVYELMQDVYIKGRHDGFSVALLPVFGDVEISTIMQDFDNFLNNITHE
jgi:hypothetical protein